MAAARCAPVFASVKVIPHGPVAQPSHLSGLRNSQHAACGPISQTGENRAQLLELSVCQGERELRFHFASFRGFASRQAFSAA